MAAELTRLTHKTTAHSGRELYHLLFSFPAASPETFGYTLVFLSLHILQILKVLTFTSIEVTKS
jgi:hypothetical protein